METSELHILLADDDEDDCYFFKQALEDYAVPVKLTAVYNGEQLMENLNDLKVELPQILFLDLNMPRKNGFECLVEIKANKKFKNIPIVIFSTSFEHEVVKLLYENGAHYYIRKPAEIKSYKRVINHALTLVTHAQSNCTSNLLQPTSADFILTVENVLS